MSSEELKQVVARLPTLPGVYLMKDELGEVIYIGKAKSLRSRVKNYFQGSDDRVSIPHILRRLTNLEHIVTESEQQAFVLERDLIQKYKPRYNIRLKDDKAYLSVRVNESAPWPRLELVRRVVNDGARYFGPYTFSYELRTLLDLIKKVVPLRTCTDTVFNNRVRPCLEYQIKRCAGPCCLEVDRDEYQEWVGQAIDMLDGKTKPIREKLEQQMERASDMLQFEEAASYRDKLEIIKNFSEKKELQSSKGEDRDVFALYREERLVSLSILLVRNGRIADNVSYYLEGQDLGDEEILESALSQFYSSNREVPEEILVPFTLENESLLQEGLKERRGGAVAIHQPKRGVKFRLLGLAELNAKQQFIAHFDKESRYKEISEGLSKMFSLGQMPRKVECVDISNLQGSDIVGALVCFYDGEPHKKGYRQYHISQQGKPDDFASIYEVVSRRIASGIKNGDLPDLLVIDGGSAQLAKAIEAREEHRIPLDIISLAKMRTEKRREKKSNIQKKPERVFVPGSDMPTVLDPRSEVTYFLQRIRDEVHRSAITFHRKTRGKRVRMTALDEVRGVGPERKKRLLKEFSSIEKIGQADATEIARIGRMPLPLAEKIKAHLTAKD